jgi:hypothetical protein
MAGTAEIEGEEGLIDGAVEKGYRFAAMLQSDRMTLKLALTQF